MCAYNMTAAEPLCISWSLSLSCPTTLFFLYISSAILSWSTSQSYFSSPSAVRPWKLSPSLSLSSPCFAASALAEVWRKRIEREPPTESLLASFPWRLFLRFWIFNSWCSCWITRRIASQRSSNNNAAATACLLAWISSANEWSLWIRARSAVPVLAATSLSRAPLAWAHWRALYTDWEAGLGWEAISPFLLIDDAIATFDNFAMLLLISCIGVVSPK